jgi:hypothetical protein
MSIVKEAAEALKAVAEGIEHIRTVAKAVSDGKDYLKLKHPEIKNDLVLMCAEMENTCIGVAAASAILTHFKFTVAGSAVDSEPVRFNQHLVDHKEKAAHVTSSLHSLRGHCHVIEHHVEELRKRAGSLNLDHLLLLFGIDSTERDQRVEAALQNIYNEEMQAYQLVTELSKALRLALDDVSNALGPKGMMLPANVPVAAALLGEYADAFGALESLSNYIALDLQQSIDALQ